MMPSTPRSPRRTVHRLFTLIPPALFGLAAAVTLAGCPVGAELEDPERFIVGTGGTGAATGGTGPATGGTAGSGGGSTTPLVVDCDYVTALNAHCSRSGCHNASSAVADLSLAPNPPEGLVARLKDKPATHTEIDCGMGGPYVECIPATCPAPGSALLVNSENPDESWMLKKLNGTHNECGLDMPVPPGDTGFDDVRKACLDKLVRAIAAL